MRLALAQQIFPYGYGAGLQDRPYAQAAQADAGRLIGQLWQNIPLNPGWRRWGRMNDQLYSIHEFPNAAALNSQILGELDRLIDSPAVRRSHFFHGRFENLYIPLDSIPVVSDVLCFARQAAAERLRCHVEQLRAGFWFNLMPPGAVTSLHSHEEDDELMSAAYYISVPDASGDLILRPDSNEIRITPREGHLVLFAPSLPHEVAENRSSRTRLSIGINIGPVPDA